MTSARKGCQRMTEIIYRIDPEGLKQPEPPNETEVMMVLAAEMATSEGIRHALKS